MNIHTRKVKEVIQVFHNSQGAMIDTVKQLKEVGWSGNTRMSVTGLTLSRMELSHMDIEWVNENHPDVVIQEPDPDSFLYTQPYVFYTEHERIIEEG